MVTAVLMFAEIEAMRKQMQDEIREQLLANQQMMEDNTGWDAKLSQVIYLVPPFGKLAWSRNDIALL